MTNVLDELVALLSLERTGENSFRGASQDLGWGTVYGGQVLGQALSAAAQTVPAERPVHSLHAYFLRAGDVNQHIDYEVDRIRDGGSFTTRRVVAIQSGKPIFHLGASFQAEEEGFSHQDSAPEAPDPEGLPSEQERLARSAFALPKLLRERANNPSPFQIKIIGPEEHPLTPTKRTPERMVWLRTSGALGDDPALHRFLLAYASDYAFLTTALLPHGVTWLTRGMQVASLDHAMWFHHRFRVDEWLLHVIDSPVASGARGLVRGRIFDAAGRLVASTTQEGLIRQRT